MFARFTWYLVVAIAICGFVVISAASADTLTLTTPNGVTFVLRDSPCGEEISAVLKDEYREQFKGATASYDGKSEDLCWLGPNADNDIILINAQGHGAAIPMKNFMRLSVVTTPNASI